VSIGLTPVLLAVPLHVPVVLQGLGKVRVQVLAAGPHAEERLGEIWRPESAKID
jgi:hypothetical protein